MSKGSAKSVVYVVEARTSYPQPQEYAGMLLGNNWQRVDFSAAPEGFGVPNHVFSSADKHGYLTYETAQALRWWFHAARPLPACMETRLVAYDYEETWSANERGVSAAQERPRRPFDEFTPRPASAIEAAAAGETQSGSTEGESATRQGDAQMTTPKDKDGNASCGNPALVKQ